MTGQMQVVDSSKWRHVGPKQKWLSLPTISPSPSSISENANSVIKGAPSCTAEIRIPSISVMGLSDVDSLSHQLLSTETTSE